MDLQIRRCLIQAQDKNDSTALRKAYSTLKDVSERTASDVRCFLPELYVLCAEQALRLGCKEITEDCLMMYLESNPPPNQFLCRAYFCQAQLNSLCSPTSVDHMEKAVVCCLKAIEVSKDKPRYHFLVFNASVLYFQTVKGFLRPGLCQNLLSSLTQVLGALEEVHEPDYAWRAELMILRVECLLDAGKKCETEEYSKVTSEFIKLHTPELYPRIFSIQVRHNLLDVADILTELSPQLRTIYKIQKLKDMKVSKCGNAAEELGEIFLLLTQSPQSQSPACHISRSENSPSITLTERIELLLELAFLSLEVKEPRCAKDCLKELETIDLSVGQRIMAECIECGVSLLKQSGCIEDYTKSSVETQLAVVGRLEALVCRAVTEGDAQVTQCVCAALWNSCLPMLQHNLRRSVKKPLLTLARALEGINSMLLEVRCQVHTELAAIEEEGERLEVAIKHLHSALDLDETGQYRQVLSSSLHRLQLRSKPYSAPTRPEDQAAMLIQQVQQGKDKGSSAPAKKWHSMLVSAGMALAPDTFQMVLDADSSTKVLGSTVQDYMEQLANKALHHKTCVQKAEGHLAGMERDTDDQERMRLWASLVKAARKLELWNVCRAACRFCLLYDDQRWKIDRDQMYKGEKGKRELLRLLAEVHFINAEAIIHKLLSEGVELNVLPVPSIKKGACVPENDPQWTVYSDWIQELSAYATANFLQGAELGAELQEPWLVVNAAVYLWNYNSHILSARGHNTLLPTFSRLVELLSETGHAGEVVLLVLLCDVVAQGTIQPWCGIPVCTAQKEGKLQAQADKNKKSGGKGMEKSGSSHGLEANVLQDLKKALQLCEYALHLCNGNDKKVPIMVRKQLISTWVKTKQLLQQQIGQKLNSDDECKNEAVAAMSQVLVGVEMLLCNNNPGLMEFTVPSHAMLVRMVSVCKWTDPVVELYAWYQLAHSAHQCSDHDLVMICTQHALQLERTAIQKTKSAVYKLYSVKAVQEMLSSAACMRGLSMLHNSCGHLAKYMEALGMLQSSISFAEQADSWPLCGNAVRCYWNACLPLLEIPEQRQQLQNPLEQILKALTHTYPQPATERSKVVTSQKEMQTTSAASVTDTDTIDDLAVRAALYNVLFHIHADRGNLKCGLQVLDHAIREMPCSPHKLVLCKQRVLARAQLGESVELDMQKLAENGELECATMWHHVAHSARDKPQQMHGFQNAIAVLQTADSRWHKVYLLLEFVEWLYSNNFPVTDAQLQIQSAMDILLSSQSETSQSSSCPTNPKIQANKHTSDNVEQADTSVSDNSLSHLEVQATLCLPILPEIQRLCALVQAHTLLALMESRVSAQHQQHLIQAYHFVLKIWQVSMEKAQEAIKEALKNPVTLAPPVSAPGPKKDVEKEKGQSKKSKEPPPVEKKPRVPVSETSLPSSTEEWVRFECSEELRQAFWKDCSSHSVSSFNVSMQSRTLFYLDVLVKELESVSLTPLTLPPLYLAEVIAHDLLNIKSHSDLYRLRIVKTCCELGLETSSPYRETLLSLAHIPEEEQMLCRKAITLQKERKGTEAECRKTHEMASGLSRMATSEGVVCRTRLDRHTLQELWMEKAAVCLRMGLHQPARCLLAEAHLLAKELGDQTLLAKCFLLLATLASLEEQHDQACAVLEHAQEIGGDEDFWYNLSQSLLNITAKLDGDPYAQITDTAIGVFRSVIDQGTNRAPILHFYIASLQATGAVLCRIAVKPACPGQAVNAETVRRLNSVCDTLKHAAATLLQYGYKTPAAETAVEQANTLRMLAMLTSIEEEKQKHLLDALSLMQQAVSLQEEVLSSCLRLLSPHECEWNRLPAMRVCVRLRLAFADLGLLMLEIQCKKEMVQAKIRSMKSPTERAVDDYIRSSTDLSDLENEWLTVVQTVGQVTLSQLTVVHSLSKHSVEIRTRCLCMLGKCLRLMAHRRDPLCPATMWDRTMVADCAEWKENSTEDKNEESSKEAKECTLQEGSKSADLQSVQTAVEKMLKQAIESLTEALTLGLQHNLPELLCHVCVELLECHGQYDPATSGQYLALLQSCMCCTEMSRVLLAACSNSDQSQVAALLGLQKSLKVTQQNRESCMLSAIDHELRTVSKAYRQLSISPNHLNFLGEIPSNIKILLLQHTEDGSVVYGAFYEKVQAIEGLKKKSIQMPGGLVCSRVAKAQVQPSDLLRLQDQVQAFRHLTAQTLLKESRRHRSAVQTEHYRQLDHVIDQELRTQFQAIVKEMEDYLHPILSQFDFSCFSSCRSVIAIDEETQPKEEEGKRAADKALPGSMEEQEQCVVLLADRMLLELPIEALSVLQQNLISCVSRDLSLQVFHSRLQRDEPVESDNKKETKDGKSAKGKGDQGKGIKMAPVNRVLPAHALPVDTHKVKYIIDLHTEKKDSQWSSLAESIRKTLEMYAEFTAHWEGIMGSEKSYNPEDLEHLLANCSSFIFCSPDRLLSHISPARLTTLNLNECQMAILFDLIPSETCMWHQSQRDVQTSKVHQALEAPLECVYLLTLCGVHSVMLNQWPSSPMENVHNLDAIFENLLKKGLTSGQAVFSLHRKGMKEENGNTSIQREAENAAVENAVPCSAFNFIIYGLPNLVVI